MLDDTFMKLSDFNALITPLGYAPVSLDQEYLIVSSLASVEAIDWSDCVLERGGKTYTVQAVTSDYPVFCRIYFYVVVPDEVVEGMAIQTNYTVYDVADGPYDALGLRQALTYLLPNE